MEPLQRQVRIARRRLIVQQFCTALVWSSFAALVVALAAIGASKLWPLAGESPRWAALWLGGALAAAVIAAGGWTWARRRSQLEAALEIDRRFGLQERVSSALALAPAERGTPAGEALLSDSIRRVSRLHVGERFRLGLGRRALLPLLPGALAFVLAVFVENKLSEPSAQAKAAGDAAGQIRKSAQSLEKKLAERRQEARKKGLGDAENLFNKLEQESKSLAAKNDADRKQAMIKLNDLAKDIESRKQQLAGQNQLKQQLGRLKDLQKGPADKMADALKEGDFGLAKKELEKLRQQLENGKLNEAEKKQVAQQAEQLKQALEKLAAQHRQAREELKKQIAEAEKQGQPDKAQQLQKKLDELKRQAPQMDKLAKLAQKLGDCGKGLAQGQGKQAAQDLQELADQLGQMQNQADELAMLEDALGELLDAKESMDCKQCGGQGCKACQGQGQGNNQDGKPGMGLGRGRGQGERPKAPDDTKFYDSKVQQKPGQGAAVVTGLVDGPNRKGQVQAEIKAQFSAEAVKNADPLTNQPLPRDKRRYTQEYFDALRK